jgi:periplasmic protein CpxP/Spy
MKRLATLLCLMTLTALPVFAGGAATTDTAGAPAHAHGFHGKAALENALNLTDEQKAAVKPLRDELRATTQPLFAQLREQHQQLRAALDSGADAATVGEKAIAAHATQQKIKEAHDKFSQSFSALLTPEQQAKFQKLQERRGAWQHGRGGFLPPAQ